jgi:hypothetical protein
VKTLKNRAAGVALVLQVLVALTGSARAAVVLKLDLPELVLRAEHIVVAVAGEEISRFTPDGRIVTDVTLKVTETLKGDLRAGQDIVVTRLGGEVGEIGMLVEGEPRFRRGRPAVLFLRELSASGKLQVVGMSQGVFQVEERDGRMYQIPGSDLALVHRSADGEMVEDPRPAVEPGPLDDLLSEIRRLVAESHGR